MQYDRRARYLPMRNLDHWPQSTAAKAALTKEALSTANRGYTPTKILHTSTASLPPTQEREHYQTQILPGRWFASCPLQHYPSKHHSLLHKLPAPAWAGWRSLRQVLKVQPKIL